MILYISLALSAVSGITGSVYLRAYLKQKEEKYTRTQAAVYIAITAVLFCAMGLMPLFLLEDDMTYYEMIRAQTAVLGLYFPAIIDWKYKVIPNKYLLVLLGVTLLELSIEALWSSSTVGLTLFNSLLGSGICGTMFLITNLVSHNSLGMGDVKLMYVLGLLTGLDDALGGLFWALLFSLVTGVVLMIAKKAKLKSKIPMCPFFFFGFLTSNIVYIITGMVGG